MKAISIFAAIGAIVTLAACSGEMYKPPQPQLVTVSDSSVTIRELKFCAENEGKHGCASDFLAPSDRLAQDQCAAKGKTARFERNISLSGVHFVDRVYSCV